MKHLVFLTTLLLTISFSHAQDTTHLKRTPYKLSVAVDRDVVYTEEIKATPYVTEDNSVLIYPGEKIFIEVDEDGGVIKRFTAVKENANPSKTLVITLTQVTKRKVHEMMMLSVMNPLKKTLTYKANFTPLHLNKWLNTDVLPVQAGLSGYETWPNVFTRMLLTGWQFEAQ